MEKEWNLVGYARVSTDDQDLSMQIDALTKHGVAEGAIYKEHVSGVAKHRAELEMCLRRLREGDCLVVWSLDRLGRNLGELVQIINRLDQQEAQFRSLTQHIDTTTAIGKMIFAVVGAFAQFERDMISERTKAGLAARQAQGKILGRRPGMTPAQWEWAAAHMPGLSIAAVQEHPEFRALGWPDGQSAGKATIGKYRNLLIAGEPYPAEWGKYLQREESLAASRSSD